MSSGDEAPLPVNEDEVKTAIGKLIEKEGLDKITSRRIRDHLQNHFNVDFSNFRKVVDQLTKQVIDAKEGHNGDDSDGSVSSKEASVPPEKPKTSEKTKKIAQNNDSDSDSDPGLASSERARPVKKPKKKTQAVDDSAMDLMSAVKSRTRTAAKQAKENLKRTAVRRGGKKEKKDRGEDPEPKFGKMTQLCYISDELQVVTNKKFMKRCDVVKELWAYLRRNELFDQKDKRFAICDDVLMSVFKQKRFRCFSMMRFLGRHIMEPSHVSEELVQEAEEEKAKLIEEWKDRQSARELTAEGASLPTETRKSRETVSSEYESSENEAADEVEQEEDDGPSPTKKMREDDDKQDDIDFSESD